MSFLKEKHRHSSKKSAILIISVIAAITLTVGGTVGYLISRTPPTVNEFTPAAVSCEVSESFDGNIKKDVAVKNTGNVDAYIRAYVVANYVDSDGLVLSTAPLEGTDFRLFHTAGKWLRGSDGFWYYNEKIAPSRSTENLIDSVELLTEAPDGYYLSLQIIATAIQADPEDAVKESWKVNIMNGVLSPN